jgi:NADPH-dependent 2,4-dienoyl-CoA reductase/sulfur reductase-like enzyme
VAFAKAESVLIVGAGAAGLEVAGELTSLYAGKRVTIVHPYDRVLKTSDQLGNKDFSYVPVSDWLCDSLEMQLRARGVEFVLGDRVVFPESEDVPQGDWTGHKGLLPGLQTVHLKSGKTVSTDLVFVSTGNKPNAGLVKVADERSLAGPYIAVDGFFRVHAEDSAGVMGGQYCAIGDCANVPGRKRSGIAIGEGYKLAKMLAATLKAEARGQTAVLKPHNRWRGTSITVPLHDGHGAPGDGIGAGEIDLWILGKWSVPTFFIRMLAKDYVANQFFSLFRGVQPVSRG